MMVGTTQSNRKGIGDLKNMENREDQSTKVYWNEDDGRMSVTSYVVNTKSSGKQNVLVLSMMQPLLGVTKDDGKKKPAIIKLYDFTKVGQTLLIRKWPIIEISQMDSVCIRIHARCCTCKCLDYFTAEARKNHRASKSGEGFLTSWEFAMSLLTPRIRACLENPRGLPGHIIRSMWRFLGQDVHPPRPVLEGTHTRCCPCQDECERPGYKEKRNRLGKTVHQCDTCRRPICVTHMLH